ncbi:cardiolipin synthase [Zhouia sp. PK063]|uniref:cardiolipin synthase n=1 Tax=Zhouia sp. PK063 TaxID=3373602 RepID=UPI00379901E6
MLIILKDHFWQILVVLNYIFVVFTAFSLILSNTNPTRTFSYLLILVLFPYVGLVIYYLFGQQYRKNKIFKRKNILNQAKIKRWQHKLELNKDELAVFEKQVVEDKIKLIKLLHSCQEAPLTKHNKIDLLNNGDAVFKALFADVNRAQKTIHLEYYIFNDDTIGGQLINLLCKKAAQGVKVRLSYDSVGSQLSNTTKRKLLACGVEYHPFMPVYFPKFTGKLNYRNHRKIVVIDGKIGYVGGVNVSDRYVNSLSKNFWRDTHVRIEGEAVGSLQLNFLLNWDFVTDEEDIKVETDFFPEIKCPYNIPIQIAASGPDTDWANIMEVIFLAINSARKNVYITTPYFIPNDEILGSILTAAKCGIDVKLIIPKHSDSWAAKYASASFIDRLLEAGVKVYFYKKGFVHSKTMIVDDVFATVGTSNMDYRSFNINFEINAVVYDRGFTEELLQSFMQDLENCEMVIPDRWANRPFLQKIKESFCRLWAPVL